MGKPKGRGSGVRCAKRIETLDGIGGIPQIYFPPPFVRCAQGQPLSRKGARSDDVPITSRTLDRVGGDGRPDDSGFITLLDLPARTKQGYYGIGAGHTCPHDFDSLLIVNQC